MRKWVAILLFALPITSIGQKLAQEDLIDIVRVAFEEGKLPIELTPKLDSIFKLQFPDPMIVIKANPSMGTKRQYDVTSSKSKVMIWDGEDIFLYYVLYWMTPTETLRDNNIAVIKYETTAAYGRRPGVEYKCFKGDIKAKFDGQKWKIVRSRTTHQDCRFEK